MGFQLCKYYPVKIPVQIKLDNNERLAWCHLILQIIVGTYLV